MVYIGTSLEHLIPLMEIISYTNNITWQVYTYLHIICHWNLNYLIIFHYNLHWLLKEGGRKAVSSHDVHFINYCIEIQEESCVVITSHEY